MKSEPVIAAERWEEWQGENRGENKAHEEALRTVGVFIILSMVRVSVLANCKLKQVF